MFHKRKCSLKFMQTRHTINDKKNKNKKGLHLRTTPYLTYAWELSTSLRELYSVWVIVRGYYCLCMRCFAWIVNCLTWICFQTINNIFQIDIYEDTTIFAVYHLIQAGGAPGWGCFFCTFIF